MDDNFAVRTEPDTSGLARTPDTITSAWISVPKAARLLLDAGLPRNKRTIRRYCERGDLECHKTENALHQPQYFIDPQSLAAYIDQQRTLLSGADMSGSARTEPDGAGPVLTTVATPSSGQGEADTSGQSRTEPGLSGQPTGARIGTHDQESLFDTISFLKEQVRVKDQQIATMHERERETNHLIHGLQQGFTRLMGFLPAARETRATQEDGDSSPRPGDSGSVEWGHGRE